MHVKLKSNDDYGKDSGKTKMVTNNLPDYYSQKAYELDNETDAIYLAEDFEYCIEYPSQALE